MKEIKPSKGLEEIGEEPETDAGVPEEGTYDPFSPEHAPGLSLIVLMRIYDVQMALLRAQNKEAANTLHDLHSQGKILGSLPVLDLNNDETSA